MKEKVKEILANFQEDLPLLSDQTLLSITEKLDFVTLNKGDYFLRSGETCRKIGILVKGVFRVHYFANNKGYTSYFNVENRNQIVGGFTSFLKEEESIENIQAMETCSLFTLSYSSLQNLFNDNIEMERFGRIMAEKNYLMAMERIYDLQHQNATYKYEKFLKLYPGLMNRILHHYIASYLGITAESLSKVRKAIL